MFDITSHNTHLAIDVTILMRYFDMNSVTEVTAEVMYWERICVRYISKSINSQQFTATQCYSTEHGVFYKHMIFIKVNKRLL